MDLVPKSMPPQRRKIDSKISVSEVDEFEDEDYSEFVP
jgi:hypothetical protein